jgi:hypothetical protein
MPMAGIGLNSNKEGFIMPQQMVWFFTSIAFSLIVWGIVATRYIWPELRVLRRVDALRPVLILHSFRFIGIGIPGSRRRVTRSAACFRAFRRLWGHHCCDTGVGCAAIVA